MRRFCMFLSVTLGSTITAKADPLQITWEWYNTAETYRNYKVKGKDDLRISARYFRMAAEKGNSTAAYKLGEAYEEGIGLPKDPVQALDWYRRAASQGDKYADLRIGYFYQKGIVVPRDPVAAVDWYRKSAAKENIWAYHMLAFMLADGEGLPKDVKLAKAYLEKSLPQTNDHWAKWKLARLIQAEDPARAKQLLKEASAAGNAQAADELQQFK
jgi:uncharacterized protein